MVRDKVVWANDNKDMIMGGGKVVILGIDVKGVTSEAWRMGSSDKGRFWGELEDLTNNYNSNKSNDAFTDKSETTQ